MSESELALLVVAVLRGKKVLVLLSWLSSGRGPADGGVLADRVRDVAQPGSALAWGASGRKFESCRPD